MSQSYRITIKEKMVFSEDRTMIVDFEYFSTDHNPQEIITFLNDEIIAQRFSELINEAKFALADNKYKITSKYRENRGLESPAENKLSENLAQQLGFDDFFISERFWNNTNTYYARNLPNDYKSIDRILWYHPDLICGNFNDDPITSLYIRGHEEIEYYLMYPVKSLSPTPFTSLFYYDENLFPVYLGGGLGDLPAAFILFGLLAIRCFLLKHFF